MMRGRHEENDKTKKGRCIGGDATTSRRDERTRGRCNKRMRIIDATASWRYERTRV